jgi:hypothetical protein
MSTLREAAQQALEALEATHYDVGFAEKQRLQVMDAITALRAALEQPEPRNQCGETCERAKLCAVCARGLEKTTQTPCDIAEDGVCEVIDCCRNPTQEEQEPVAYTGDVARRMREAEMTFHLGMPHAVVMQQMTRFHDLVCAEASIKSAAAFAAPPRREWQSLTDTDIARVFRAVYGGTRFGPSEKEFAIAVEAKLKEKNHG